MNCKFPQSRFTPWGNTFQGGKVYVFILCLNKYLDTTKFGGYCTRMPIRGYWGLEMSVGDADLRKNLNQYFHRKAMMIAYGEADCSGIFFKYVRC